MARISKSRKRRLLVIGTASLIAFVFFCVNVFNYSYKIIMLTKEQNRLVGELNDLKDRKEELDIEIKKLQDEDYIANFARENYSYSRENEIVIKTKDSNSYAVKIEENEKDLINTSKNLKTLKTIVLAFIIAGILFFLYIARVKKA